VLAAPLSGTTADSNQPTFEWNPVADIKHYEIQIDNNGDFNSLTATGTPSGTSFTPVRHWLMECTRGASGRLDYAGNQGLWSAVWTCR